MRALSFWTLTVLLLQFYNAEYTNTRNALDQTYHNQYEVSFDIKPFGLSVRSWESIIHFTNRANQGRYGNSIPAIWFNPLTKRLNLCSTLNNSVSHCFRDDKTLPKRRYTHVRLAQHKDRQGRFVYSISINGVLKHVAYNERPTNLYNIQGYLGNPWHTAARVKNVKIKTSSSDGFKPSRSNRFKVLPQLEKQWYLSFDILPGKKVFDSWTNIVHSTIGGNNKNYGDRIPAVWFRPQTTGLCICTALGTDKNYCYNHGNLPKNRFTNIQIRQTWSTKENVYKYIITINGVVKRTVTNSRAQIFENVKLWASSPWHKTANAFVRNLVFKNLPNGYSYSDCLQPRSPRINCASARPITSFRSVEGICNNLQKPTLGSTNTPLKRILPASYARDGLHDTPRGYPNTDPVLPPANKITQTVFKTETSNPKNTGANAAKLSTMFMTFGQFLDHDFAFTPHTTCKEKCGTFNVWQHPCFPILFKKNSKECSLLGRSFAMCTSRAYIDDREQMNALTSFIDGSQIYGNEVKMFNEIRENKDGLLQISSSGLLLLGRKENFEGCSVKDGCSLAGERRSDENIALLAMHTLWVREHNRIAKELKKVNPNWNDDLIFMTTRKIVGAILQNIVYTEFLPNLIQLPKYKKYNPSTDPSLINSFAHAAFRFGHSLVPDQFEQLDKGYNEKSEPVSLRKAFRNRNYIVTNGIEGTIFGLLKNTSRPVDNKFSFSLSRRLFVGVGHKGYRDLIAVNIQRAREHGLPGYNEYRKACGLRVAKTWPQLKNILIPGAAAKFEKVYDTPDDIDLYAGAISENHSPNSMIGPLFSCIIYRQFKNLRDGDRFYYENKDIFTPSQLKEIKKVTLSTVLCNNLKDIVSIQPHALLAVGERNLRKSCRNEKVFKDLDIKFWESSVEQNERQKMNDKPQKTQTWKHKW